MGRFGKFAILAAAAAIWAAPAAAQESIALEAGEPYIHPHSGITIPAKLGGMTLSNGVAYAQDSLDVAFAFDSEMGGETLTVYIFRRTNGAVPIWFAQARSAIEGREGFASLETAFAPSSFTPQGQDAASGLRVTYGAKSGDIFSTGLALFQADEWYVKVRATSQRRAPAELHAWIDVILGELILPEGNAPEAYVIADCEKSLRFRGRSKNVETDDGSSALASLFGSLLTSVIEDESAQNAEEGESGESAATHAEPVMWCRDEQLATARATYRADANTDSYLLALGDNGNGVRVAPNALARILSGADASDDEEPSNFSITLMTAHRNISFAAQDRLPSPERVLDLLQDNRPLGSTSTWGDDQQINVNSEMLK